MLRLRLAVFVLGLALLAVSVVATVERHTDEPVQLRDARTGPPLADTVLCRDGVPRPTATARSQPQSGPATGATPSALTGAAIAAPGLALLLFALSSFRTYERRLRDAARCPTS